MAITLFLVICFNPRSREGATFSPPFTMLIIIRFNPRSREGATYPLSHRHGVDDVSIHAPVKERLSAFPKNPTAPMFQSTLP